MSQFLRPATIADVVHVASNIRKEDADECYAAAGAGPELALLISAQHSTECYAMVSPHGNVIGLCGLAPGLGASDRRVWMMATRELESHQITFLRHAKAWVEEKSKLFVLWNYVDANNTKHVSWLKSLGVIFTTGKTSPYTGSRLLHFIKVPTCV